MEYSTTSKRYSVYKLRTQTREERMYNLFYKLETQRKNKEEHVQDLQKELNYANICKLWTIFFFYESLILIKDININICDFQNNRDHWAWVVVFKRQRIKTLNNFDFSF